jgi:hypothetical protein
MMDDLTGLLMADHLATITDDRMETAMMTFCKPALFCHPSAFLSKSLTAF